MSERLNIYHKVTSGRGNIGEKKDFIGLTNNFITDSTILVFLKQYLNYQKNNDNSINKLYNKENLNDYTIIRNKKILNAIFSINNESQKFYNIEEMETIEKQMEDFRRFFDEKQMKERFNEKTISEHGFDYECDNGRMFLKNDDNLLPKVGFLNLEEDSSFKNYSYKIMTPSEFRSYTLIKHLANYDEVFKTYHKGNKTHHLSKEKKLDEFIEIFKDSLETIKNELNYYKKSDILNFIKENSAPYTEKDIEKDLSFFKEEKENYYKSKKQTKKLNEIMKEHLNIEKEKLNNVIDDFYKDNNYGNNKGIENKIEFIKHNYNKRVELLNGFIEKNVENKRNIKIDSSLEKKSDFSPTMGI